MASDLALVNNFPSPYAEFLLGDEERDRAQPSFGFRTYSEGVAVSQATLGTDPIGGMVADLIGGGGRVQGGMDVHRQVSSMHGWAFICVQKIRNAIGKVPFRLYEPGGPKGKLRPLDNPNHPLAKLLKNPNPLDTRSGFWSITVTFYELTGNAFWLKVRDGLRTVRELWPIPSQYLTPAHTREQLLVGYRMDTGVGSPFLIPREDVVHFRQPNPKDRFWGLGTLAAAANAMKADDQIKASRLQSFNNDIMSTLYFTTDQMLADESWRRMMASLREKYHGAMKAGLPLLLYGGVKPAQITRPPQEMAYKESAGLTRDEILSTFGVYPLLAGVVENANNSNTASEERVFALYTVQPKLTEIQERINKDVVSEFDDRLEFEFDDPVPPDVVQQSVIDQRYVVSNIKTPNEVRVELGLPETEWGNLPIGLSMVAAKAPAPQPRGIPKAKGNSTQLTIPRGTPRVESQTVQVERPSSGEVARLPGRRSPLSQNRAILVRTIQEDHEKLERSAVPVLRKYFARQAKRVQENVRRIFAWVGNDESPGVDAMQKALRTIVYRQSDVWVAAGAGHRGARLFSDGTTIAEAGSDSFGILGAFVEVPCCTTGEFRRLKLRSLPDEVEGGLDDWEAAADELAAKMLPKIEEGLKTGARTQLDSLDIDQTFDLQSHQAQDFLREKDRTYWRDTVNETTKKLLSEKLAAVLADHPTLDKLSAAVEEVMAGRIKSSSSTIALTETIGAYNGGADIVRTGAGVQQKQWLATLDGHTRLAHLHAEGQVVLQNGSFLVGGELLRYPADPRGSVANIVRCRCAGVAYFGDGN